MYSRWMLLLCGLVFTTGAFAEPYPTRAIRIIVPYAPGGNTDVISRSIAAKMTESLGYPVIVENRPGASAIIGSEQAKFAQLGITMTASKPKELADLIETETAKWSKTVREFGIKTQ